MPVVRGVRIRKRGPDICQGLNAAPARAAVLRVSSVPSGRRQGLFAKCSAPVPGGCWAPWRRAESSAHQRRLAGKPDFGSCLQAGKRENEKQATANRGAIADASYYVPVLEGWLREQDSVGKVRAFC